jgi:2-dehydropantoate 2-reductase
LLLNTAVNPITALTLRRMEVFADPGLRELAAALMTEAAEVGRAAGARLDDTDVAKILGFFDEFAQNNGTSMLYDRLAGRPLEYDALNGAVIRTAERHGIDVPLQRTVLALMRSLGPLHAPGSTCGSTA